MMRLAHIAALIAAALVLLTAAPATADVLCVCRCCSRGDCTLLRNASWAVDDCSECSATKCRAVISDPSVQKRMSRTFQVLQDIEDLLSRTSGKTLSQEDEDDKSMMLSYSAAELQENPLDMCEVMSMVESITCSVSDTCKISTDVTAECYDSNAPVIKYSVWGGIVFVFVLVAFAFVKNHLMSCQEVNVANFNY